MLRVALSGPRHDVLSPPVMVKLGVSRSGGIGDALGDDEDDDDEGEFTGAHSANVEGTDDSLLGCMPVSLFRRTTA
jgi:hypothetical protein